MHPQPVYQRVDFRSSDIKSAVAFFNMVFSRSRRFTRASSLCMRCCSGVNVLDLGVLPPRSDSSCRTHLRRVFSCTFLLKLLMNGLNRSNYFRAALQPFFLCKGDDNFWACGWIIYFNFIRILLWIRLSNLTNAYVPLAVTQSWHQVIKNQSNTLWYWTTLRAINI